MVSACERCLDIAKFGTRQLIRISSNSRVLLLSMSKDGVCMMLARSLQDLSHTPWRGSHVHCHPWI